MNAHRLQPKFTITNAITTALARIERARGFLEAATLSEDWVRAMGERALVLEAHHTTHIEGTRLTLEQSRRLWAGGNVPEADSDDARELLNYRGAFEFVAERADGRVPVTEEIIREIHRRLVDGVRGGSAAPGEYRKTQNYIVNSATGKIVYTPPPARDVPVMMREMVNWLNRETEIHAVLVSGIAQFQLVHVHPFLDGNGRTSRLLSTLCLYRSGYDFKRLFTISEFYDRDHPAFYKAIQSVREDDMDMTRWLEFFVKGLSMQLREITRRGEQAVRLDALGREQGLSERQSLALRYALEHDELSIRDYEKLCPGVSHRTLQRDLRGMVNKGLLSESGTGPTDPARRYRLAARVR